MSDTPKKSQEQFDALSTEAHQTAWHSVITFSPEVLQAKNIGETEDLHKGLCDGKGKTLNF